MFDDWSKTALRKCCITFLAYQKSRNQNQKHKFLTAGDISNNNYLFDGSVIVWSFLLRGADIELLIRYCQRYEYTLGFYVKAICVMTLLPFFIILQEDEEMQQLHVRIEKIILVGGFQQFIIIFLSIKTRHLIITSKAINVLKE